MCKPKTPKAPPVVAPPPPVELPKPLGVDGDEEGDGPNGIESLRTRNRSGLSIRRALTDKKDVPKNAALTIKASPASGGGGGGGSTVAVSNPRVTIPGGGGSRGGTVRMQAR